MKALSVVFPRGTKIANSEKTLEIRNWDSNLSPNEELLIVENQKLLLKDGETDVGRPVAIVRIKSTREYLESDMAAACTTQWQPDCLAWELELVTKLNSNKTVLAARKIYEVDGI